jgi:hypothetical protein
LDVPISTASATPPKRLAAGSSRPLSGPTRTVLLGGAQRDGAPLGPDLGVDDGDVDPRREVGQRAPQHERAGADVVARDPVRDVDDPRVGRGPGDHAVAHADEVVVVAVVAEERQHPSHARESMHWRGRIIPRLRRGMGASRDG